MTVEVDGIKIDEIGTAKLFILARGRRGENEAEDRIALTKLLLLFRGQGLIDGLEKAKELFRQSTDIRGGCKSMSVGNACRCFLCLVDNELWQKELEAEK